MTERVILPTCPKCGSGTIRYGHKVTRKHGRCQRYQCINGHVFIAKHVELKPE